jgi:hypothetical protein
MSPASAAGKGHDPRAMSVEGRKQFDRNLRNIYGTRVKIPPPGPEREALKVEIGGRVKEVYIRYGDLDGTLLEALEVAFRALEDLAERGGA